MSDVRSETRDGVAVLTLDRKPANAFSPPLVEELGRALKDAEDADAVVLASANPRIFSAGWDLPMLLEFDRQRMASFVSAYCELVRAIFVFERPIVAALSGHAIAGGLIAAAAADERILADARAEVGLSEVLLGVPVPACLLEIFRHLLGPRAMERLAATGENLGSQRAREIGLVDDSAPGEEVLGRAVERARFLAGRPRSAYSEIKLRSRAAALARFDQARSGDPFLERWFREEAQALIRQLVQRLGKK